MLFIVIVVVVGFVVVLLSFVFIWGNFLFVVFGGRGEGLLFF